MGGIVHITSASPSAAGVVAYDMHRFLLDSGRASIIVTPVADGDDPTIHGLHRSESARRIYEVRRRALRKFNGARVFFGERNPEFHFNVYAEEKYYSTRKFLNAVPADTRSIVVHFTTGFISMGQVATIARERNASVYLLMMDMAPLTGGCHYSWDCSGYTYGCGRCPALYSNDEEDLSRLQFRSKAAALEGVEAHAIAGSEWQYRQARGSLLFRSKTVHKLLLAVDPSRFRPGDEIGARHALGLPKDSRCILFGAQYLNERRKGMHLFAEMLKMLRSYLDEGIASQCVLLIAGKGDVSAVRNSGFEYRHFGSVTLDRMLILYRAATVYVCASIEDSGPTMINQAMMSGTPVVAFEMGVAPDLIVNGETGFRVPLADTESMAIHTAKILQSDAEVKAGWRKTCRDLALEKCNPDTQMRALVRILDGE